MPAQLRFNDRVAIITGAGRGLGRAYAFLLASRGARVVVNDTGGNGRGTGVDPEPVQEVVEKIKATGGDAIACIESVATPQGARALVDACLDHYGRVDILIHSAGNVRWGSLQELTLEDFDAVLDVHLRGAFHLVRAVFPRMVPAGYGRIVLTSSISGVYGDHRLVNYAVSKTGMIGMCNVAALEGQGAGIKCNVILPGALTRMAQEAQAEGFDTRSFPPMTVEMVAPAVAWLAHESCSITGEMLIAIAGRIARAVVAETVGLHRESWTVEQVAESMPEIRNTQNLVIFSPVPAGQADHLCHTFAMSRSAR